MHRRVGRRAGCAIYWSEGHGSDDCKRGFGRRGETLGTRYFMFRLLIAILLGIVVGWLWPNLATNEWVKALGDGFIKLIKMVIAPIIFCTVVSGISHIQDARKVGRVGVKALVYSKLSRPSR